MKTLEQYTAYVIGRDGKFQRRIDFRSPDEEYARHFAKKLMTANTIELWQKARVIERFEPSQRK